MHKIMVVDDEPVITQILERFLKLNGYEVVSTNDPGRIMDIIRAEKNINLMLLDMKMPGMTGTQVLRKLSDEKIDLPVIILTGSIDRESHAEEFKSLGYDYNDAMQKPVDLYELLDKIKSKLSERN